MLAVQASGGGRPERREAPLAMPQSEWRSKNEVRDLRRRKPIRKMARKRAQQRWSALLVRISRQVHLEGSLWADFVAHANRLYKPAFIAAFEEAPVLACVGPVGGSPCGFCVDLASSDAFTTRSAAPRPRAGRCRHLRPPLQRQSKRDSRSGDAAISMRSGSVALPQAEYAALRDTRRRRSHKAGWTLNSRRQRVHARVG